MLSPASSASDLAARRYIVNVFTAVPNRLDRLTQDYLHKLELEKLNYSERAKIATKLSRCRQLRRQSKDTVEILEPLIAFIEGDKGKQMLNLMKEVLGQTRKVEGRMDNRVYRYRVIEDGDKVE